MLSQEQIENFKYPNGYIPFEEINLCSNKLTNVKLIFIVGNIVPLIIGKGDVPLIWLKAFDGRKWISILEMNKSTHILSRSIVVNDLVTVYAGKSSVIKAKIVDGICKVLLLDLRPLGLNIYGDEKLLTVGEGEFFNNKFDEVGAMIGIPGI